MIEKVATIALGLTVGLVVLAVLVFTGLKIYWETQDDMSMLQFGQHCESIGGHVVRVDHGGWTGVTFYCNDASSQFLGEYFPDDLYGRFVR